MRIGRIMIDTDNMTTDELSIIIRELREIRARKLKAEEMTSRMKDLLAEAKEAGFTFIDKDFGQVWTPNDVGIYDEH